MNSEEEEEVVTIIDDTGEEEEETEKVEGEKEVGVDHEVKEAVEVLEEIEKEGSEVKVEKTEESKEKMGKSTPEEVFHTGEEESEERGSAGKQKREKTPEKKRFPEFKEYFTKVYREGKIKGSIELAATIVSYNVIQQFECLAGDEVVEKVPELIINSEDEVLEAVEQVKEKMRKNLDLRELIYKRVSKIFSQTSLPDLLQEILDEVESPLSLYASFQELYVRGPSLRDSTSEVISPIREESPFKVFEPPTPLLQRLGLPLYLSKTSVIGEEREELINTIIEKAAKGENILINGERGIGKTTLLYFIYQEEWTDPKFTPVYLTSTEPVSLPENVIGNTDKFEKNQFPSELSKGLITTLPNKSALEDDIEERGEIYEVPPLSRTERMQVIEKLAKKFDVYLEGDAASILAHRSQGNPKYIVSKLEAYEHSHLTEEKADKYARNFIEHVLDLKRIPEGLEISFTLALFVLCSLRNVIEEEVRGIWKQISAVAKKVGENPRKTDFKKLIDLLVPTFEGGELYKVPLVTEGIVRGEIKKILSRIGKSKEWLLTIGVRTRKAVTETLKEKIQDELKNVSKDQVSQFSLPGLQEEVKKTLKEQGLTPEKEEKEVEEEKEVAKEEKEEKPPTEEREKEEEIEVTVKEPKEKEVKKEEVEDYKRAAIEEIRKELPLDTFEKETTLFESIQEIQDRMKRLEKLSLYALVLNRINQNLREKMEKNRKMVQSMEQNQIKGCKEISKRVFKGWTPEERMSRFSSEEEGSN